MSLQGVDDSIAVKIMQKIGMKLLYNTLYTLVEPYFSKQEETFSCEKCPNPYRKSDFIDIPFPTFCPKHGIPLKKILPKNAGDQGIEKKLFEVELRIIQFLKASATQESPVKAIIIAQNIDGCSYQKAMWFAKLHPEWISRRKLKPQNKRSPYVYHALEATMN